MPILEYQAHQVHYYQYGQGEALAIALHGFADKGSLFAHLEDSVENYYTILALDLPFHGETDWQDDVYTPQDVANIVELLLKKQRHSTCALMCHSMGGRLVLGSLELLIDKIEVIYFFATAGMQYTFTASNFWWPFWLRKRSKNRFIHSDFLMKAFGAFHRLGLMNRATYLVFKMQLDLPRRRARLLKTWMAMSYFPMRMQQRHIRLLNKKQLPAYFFFGKKDRITPVKKAHKIVEQLDNAELIITEGNHFFVKDKLPPAFKEWLDKKQGV